MRRCYRVAVLSVAAAAAAVLGCSASPRLSDLDAPSSAVPATPPADGHLTREFPVQTDSAVYHLLEVGDTAGYYVLRLKASFTNRTANTVFVTRQCGSGSEPAYGVERAGQDSTPVWLGQVACPAGAPIVVVDGKVVYPGTAPVPLAAVPPAGRYTFDLTLISTKSPGARPPITMQMRTGTFRLYLVVVSAAGDLLPVEQRLSNSFAVAAPTK